MKKYGKFEKRPAAKKILLHTYLTSLLSLTLCVAMFFGTSFAWFTSEVNNTQNEIYIGTLDVDMFKQDGDQWQDLASSDANTTKLFDGNIRWEPGYTTVETIKLVNKGDLAFNYVLNFIESPKDATATQAESETTTETETADELDVMEVAKFFDVWVYKHTEKNTFTNPASYDDITAAGSGWTHAGSLNELLAGKAVLTGSMDDVRENKTATVPTESTGASTETTAAPSETSKNEFDGKESDVTYTIALHMRTDATGTYKDSEGKEHSIMGHKITLNVKLIAYQMAAEKDEFSTGYDSVIPVSDAAGLKAAMEKPEGGNVLLTADIELDNPQITIPANAEVVLDLNGHKIDATLADTNTADTQLFYVSKGATLTINGMGNSQIHVKAGKNNARVSAAINNCGGTVVINGGAYTMKYGTYNEGYMIPTLVDNNSTLGESRLIINGGTFVHTRNMFRNFANNSNANQTATITINGGIFKGEAGDFGQIWNQKPSANTPGEAGKIEVNGGTFEYMQICNGFGAGTNVAVKEDIGITVGEWKESGGEWTATITSNSGNN